MSLWDEIQKASLDRYKNNPDASFSIESKSTKTFGWLINERLKNKTCLDIGCGILEMPYYMKIAKDVDFTGVDPLGADIEREFKFVKAIGELLPFKDDSFDGVSFATTLDHLQNPEYAIEEAYRVTRKYIFIWNSIKRNDEKYKTWLKKDKPALYDKYHLWAFTNETMRKLLNKFTIEKAIKIHANKNIREFIYIGKK